METSRRTVLQVSATVAGMAAVVGIPAMLFGRDPDRRQPVSDDGSAEALSPAECRYSLDLAGFRLRSHHNDLTQQFAYLEGTGTPDPMTGIPLYGHFTIYAPGGFDPAQAQRGERIDVAGTEGWYGPVDDPYAGTFDDTPVEPSPAVVWQLLPGHWTVLQSWWRDKAAERDGVLRVARAVRAARVPLPVPFRIAALPSGWSVNFLQVETSPSGAGIEWSASVGLSDGTPGETGPYAPPPPGATLSLSEGANLQLPGSNTTVNGRPAMKTGDEGVGTMTLAVHYDTCDLLVSQSIPTAADRRQELAEAVTVIGAPDDRTTWLSATEALPR